jgi:hypothetical protein
VEDYKSTVPRLSSLHTVLEVHGEEKRKRNGCGLDGNSEMCLLFIDV